MDTVEGSGSRKRTNQNGDANDKGKRAKSSESDVSEEPMEEVEEDQEPLNDDYTEGKSGKNRTERMWFITGFDYERNLVEAWVKEGKGLKHALVGFEVCPTTGKLHYHLCVNFQKAQRFAAVKKIFAAFGNSPCIKYVPGHEYARVKNYCAKKATKADPEKDVVSFGEYVTKSVRNKQKCTQMNDEWEEYKEFAKSGQLDLIPEKIMVQHYRYYRLLRDEERVANERELAEQAILNEWQSYTMKPYQKYILEKLEEPANCRDILWVYDSVGGCGKSRFAAYLEVVKGCCSLTPGKLADLAHVMDYAPTYIMDIPRCTGEAVSFAFIENLKNGKIVSGKYQGANRLFRIPHFVVLSNARPPESTESTGFSIDRIKIIKITSKEGDYQLGVY